LGLTWLRYTISDIARIANVSKATVSRVINNKSEGVSEETAQRIRKIINELGYRPNTLARSIVNSKAKMLGLVIPDITNPFFPQLVRGIEDYANSCGYTVFLCNSDNDPKKEERYLLSLIDKRVDGVILASASSHSSILDQMNNYKIPFVIVDRPLNNESVDLCVYANNYNVVYAAVEHLIRSGHKRIAFLGGTKNVITTNERYEGYKNVIKDANIPLRKSLIRFGDYSIISGAEMVESLIENNTDFTAIMAGNDLIAIGAVKTLKKRGIRIPEDCEIIGFDGIEIAEIFDPSISTVVQPVYEIAVESAKLLLGKINGEITSPRKIIVEPTLVLRTTTRNNTP
jgi:LacI family transcriptional regulator